MNEFFGVELNWVNQNLLELNNNGSCVYISLAIESANGNKLFTRGIDRTHANQIIIFRARYIVIFETIVQNDLNTQIYCCAV